MENTATDDIAFGLLHTYDKQISNMKDNKESRQQGNRKHIKATKQRQKMMTHNLRFEHAQLADADAIFAFYHSLIHMPYSTWDEGYPTREIVENDLLHNDVHVLREESGRIIAAIVLAEDEEIAQIAPWYSGVTRWIELSRLGVAADWQSQGIAKRMLTQAMDVARGKSYEAVRFLVAKSNPIAQRAYSRLGFDICGEGELWGGTWLCYQKRL